MNRFKQKMQDYQEMIEGDNTQDLFKVLAAKYSGRWHDRIFTFAKQSDRIEGIEDDVQTLAHAKRLTTLLELEELTIDSLVAFNKAGRLRTQSGMDVRVGTHEPLPGGQHILYRIEDIVQKANLAQVSPYRVHNLFETLHPFTDGNGRTGRAIWAWQMVNQQAYNLELAFLHRYYYQSLDSER